MAEIFATPKQISFYITLIKKDWNSEFREFDPYNLLKSEASHAIAIMVETGHLIFSRYATPADFDRLDYQTDELFEKIRARQAKK